MKFSVELQRVVAESRQVALRLGCDYVSTLHLLVADCQLYPLWSLRELLFGQPQALATFTEGLRVGPPIGQAGSLPLLQECELALRQLRRVARQYRVPEVQPCHFFVAASQVPSSLFAQLLAANHVPVAHVYQHFERTGQLVAPAAGAAGLWLSRVRGWLGP